MKYMGSKKSMLRNGLGEALDAASKNCSRILDLFTGSAAVAHHAASKYNIPVIAGDLQQYSVALAASILDRTDVSDVDRWSNNWRSQAISSLDASPIWLEAQRQQDQLLRSSPAIAASRARQLCAEATEGSLVSAYGGYYYSPAQVLWIEALRAALPTGRCERAIALAALIQAASRCAASPGHTAQPFKANDTAGPYLLEAWRKNIWSTTVQFARQIGAQCSNVIGEAKCADALDLARSGRPGDLVFLDPPYSSVHYSRFYHVLESICVGSAGAVTGTGRYPAAELRPKSAYSISTKSAGALGQLLATIAEKGASALITFPAGKASNGLSGAQVRELSEQYFRISESKVTSKFSTLGGDAKHRAARQDAQEMILTLSPR